MRPAHRGPAARRRRRSLAAARATFAVAVAGFVVAGCGGSSHSSSSTATSGTNASAKQGGTLNVGMYNGAFLDSVDPNLWYGLSTWEIGRQTCVPLVTYPNYGGAKGNTLVPAVAAALPEVSSDGLTYTVQIRPGLKFSNGAPLTANDVKYTFYRMVKINGAGADYFSPIKGVEAALKGKAKEISGITASGDTLTFKLTHPVGGFVQLLSLQFSCPVPAGTPVKRNETGKIPSNGPYMVESYTPRRELVIVRNPNFDPATGPKGNVDKIVFNLAVDQSQALQKIKLGEIDMTFDTLPSADAQQALTDPTLKGRVFTNTPPTLTYMWMNNDVAPFDNPKVRQAVNYAIDRDQIAKVVGGSVAAKPTDQILPPSLSGGLPTIYPMASNLDKARELIKESGVKTPVNTVLDTPSDLGFPQVAQVIQADLKQIGINLRLNVGSETVLSAGSAKRKAHRPAGFSAWTQDYPDPGNWLPLLDPRFVESPGQKARFHENSLTPRFESLEQETGPKRLTDYQQLSAQLMHDYAPWVPLFDQVVTHVVSKRVSGYDWQPQAGLPILTGISVK